MSKPYWRQALAVIVLAASLVLLGWSALPARRVIRHQQLQPTEMQLPTPESYVPFLRLFAGEVSAVQGADVAPRAAFLASPTA